MALRMYKVYGNLTPIDNKWSLMEYYLRLLIIDDDPSLFRSRSMFFEFVYSNRTLM
jgi:hypothetical protein